MFGEGLQGRQEARRDMRCRIAALVFIAPKSRRIFISLSKNLRTIFLDLTSPVKFTSPTVRHATPLKLGKLILPLHHLQPLPHPLLVHSAQLVLQHELRLHRYWPGVSRIVLTIPLIPRLRGKSVTNPRSQNERRKQTLTGSVSSYCSGELLGSCKVDSQNAPS